MVRIVMNDCAGERIREVVLAFRVVTLIDDANQGLGRKKKGECHAYNGDASAQVRPAKTQRIGTRRLRERTVMGHTAPRNAPSSVQ
jgi:hypothetical protein